MPSRALRVVCVHGIGGQEKNLAWQDDWREVIQDSLQVWAADRAVEFDFPAYDDLFEAAPLTAIDVVEAVGKLLGSGIGYGIGDPFRRGREIEAGARGLASLREEVR